MENTHSTNYGTYILVWLGLVALTTLTVAVAGLNLASLTIVVALAIATIKSLFVANYFMHVKNDSRVFKIFIVVCLVIFLTMIILTFFDLIFRSPVK
ncbi:MAG: cytochrome C oxidase subunit IV family protein [Ignavibacteriae bacterium]|nr:cytochrome C oxidase subunit IV family protein [Ignavibacteriota bacterium]